jgi:hypothetical protein
MPEFEDNESIIWRFSCYDTISRYLDIQRWSYNIRRQQQRMDSYIKWDECEFIRNYSYIR